MLLPVKRVHGQPVGRCQQLIFLHVPKCGGTFVQDVFAPYSSRCPTLTWKEARGHQTYREYRQVFRGRHEDIHDYFIMTVVRNPWAWHVSWFNYVRAADGGKKSGLKVEHKQFRKMSFRDYLNWLDDDHAKFTPPGMIKMQQTDWLCDAEGRIRVDAILRQETLFEDVSRLIEQLGIAIEPKQRSLNVSTRGDYRSYYTSDGIEQIARRHHRDIDLFGYEFDRRSAAA